jgi:hypothetical protein
MRKKIASQHEITVLNPTDWIHTIHSNVEDSGVRKKRQRTQ